MANNFPAAQCERQAEEERARYFAREREEEAGNAGANAEKAEQDRQAADEQARRFQEEAHRQAEEARKAREKADKADQERRQAEEDMRRSQEEAERQKEQARKARDDLNRGVHPDVWPTLEQFESTKARYGYTSSKVHIAIAGISGCGKSSLVNSFRGLLPKDPGAAKTGLIETTKEVARYEDPNPLNPIIWFDVPGAGTLKISDWDYFNTQGLFIFDAIVVVFADRFCATDIAILKACKKYDIPAYIVRSKSDRYIGDMMNNEASDEEGDGHAQHHEDAADKLKRVCEEYANQTRRNVMANLKEAGLPDQDVFLVSSKALWAIIKEKEKPNTLALDEKRLLKVMVGNGIQRRFKPTPALSSVLNRLGLVHRRVNSDVAVNLEEGEGTSLIGGFPIREATLSAQPIFPAHVRQHLLDHQDEIYTIFHHKVGLSADHVLLTAAFDEESLRSTNGSLSGDKLRECAHIFCDTDFAVDDSIDLLATKSVLLDVQKQVLPHSVILQTPNYKFRVCSVQPDSASGFSNMAVSFSRTTLSNTCPDRSRDPDDDGNPENRAPTDTPRLPDPNQSLAVENTTSNSETPTGSSGQSGATPEADPGPPMDSAEASRCAVFKIAFKFNKGNLLPFAQEILVSGSIGTKDVPNSPMLPDVVSSTRVEFYGLEFQSTTGSAQGLDFCYHQFRSAVDIQISKDHPIILSDKQPLSSQSSVDGQVKVVEARELTQARQIGGTVTLSLQPTVAFTGMNTTTNKAARTNEYVRPLIQVRQTEINRRGIKWQYEIDDRELQVNGLRLTKTPLLPLVQFAFCGRQGALIAPTQLDVTVRSFWEAPFCPREPINKWIEEIILRLFKRKREIPIQNFGLDVRLKLPTHMTMGSFIEKEVIIKSDGIGSSQLTRSVKDVYIAGGVEAAPLAYTD